MQPLDYSNLPDPKRGNRQMFADAWIGLGMVAPGSLVMLLTIAAKIARGGEQSQGHYLGDRWEPPGRWMGARLFYRGLQRIIVGPREPTDDK